MEARKPMLAINYYLEPYFRKELLQDVFGKLSDLSPESRADALVAVKKTVRVSGFRNPMQAPATILNKRVEETFEKDNTLATALLLAWKELYADAASLLTPVLQELGFALNAEDKLTFSVGWPDEIDYKSLAEKVLTAQPAIGLDQDQIALLTILLSMQLPE